MKACSLLLAAYALFASADALKFTEQMRWRNTEVHKKQFKLDKLERFKASGASTSYQQLTVEMPADHFNKSNTDTYKNRYFVDDRFFDGKVGGPVFFFDVGEGGIDEEYTLFEDGPESDYAEAFGGLMIIWEHRYYGSSYPEPEFFDLYDPTPGELTTFYTPLTIEQALEDVVVFASNFRYGQTEMTPDKTPWVFVGGSYSGDRGAWLAARNPGLFKATVASSAPVQLKVDFFEYFIAPENALAQGHTNCSADLHYMANWMSQKVTEKNTTAIDSFLDLVYSDGWNVTDSIGDIDIDDIRLDRLTDAALSPTSDFQYYGMDGLLGEFCAELERSAFDAKEGVAAKYGETEVVQAFALALSHIVVSADDAKLRARQDDDSTGLDYSIDQYSWQWQICTEFGAFQVGNLSRSTNIIPDFISVESYMATCNELFGTTSPKMSPNGPDVSVINDKYGGWNIQPPNVFWFNGQFDPWRALSVDSDDVPHADNFTTVVPACGQKLASGTQIGYQVIDGVHTSDLQSTEDLSSSPLRYSVEDAQRLAMNALSMWINCTTLSWDPAMATATGTAFTTPTSVPATTTAAPSATTKPHSGASGEFRVGTLLALPVVMAFFVCM